MRLKKPIHISKNGHKKKQKQISCKSHEESAATYKSCKLFKTILQILHEKDDMPNDKMSMKNFHYILHSLGFLKFPFIT